MQEQQQQQTITTSGQSKADRKVAAARAAGQELITADTEFQEFNFDDQEFDDINRWMWLLCGPTGTGKSWLIKDLLFNLRDTHMYGWIFSHTKANGFFQQFFPNNFIFKTYRPDVAQMILDLQAVRSTIRGINSYVFIILDDVASETSLRYYEATRRLAMEGRHANILTIMTSQVSDACLAR